MIWGLAAFVIVSVVGWYLFEGRWDRQLFRAEAGRVWVNLRARQMGDFLAKHPEAQILDVRSAAEFRGGALPGAIHLSFGDPRFSQQIAAFDRTRPIVVYCAGGYRSRKAVEELKRLGFRDVRHLHRGYHSWRMAGLKCERRPSA